MKFALYFLNLDDIVSIIFQQSKYKKDLQIILKPYIYHTNLLIPNLEKDIYIYISYQLDFIKISTFHKNKLVEDDTEYNTIKELKAKLQDILEKALLDNLVNPSLLNSNPFFLWYDSKESK